MRKSLALLIVVALLGFAAPSKAQIQTDPVNGWYPDSVSSGVTKFYQRFVKNDNPFSNDLGKGSQLFGVAMKAGKKILMKKDLEREQDLPAKGLTLKLDFNYVTLKPDSTPFGFNFFFSHGDTVIYSFGHEVEQRVASEWGRITSSVTYLNDYGYGIQKIDAIGFEFYARGKDIELAEIMLDNLILIQDSSVVVLDNFDGDAGIAKASFSMPEGTYDFGVVKFGEKKTVILRARNDTTDRAGGTAYVTGTQSRDPRITVTPDTAIISPGNYKDFRVTYAPIAGMGPGPWYIVFNLENCVTSAESVSVTADISTGIDDETGDTPGVYSLGKNYPNPFNPTTNMKFTIPKAGMVEFTIYSILGQKVRTLIREPMSVGVHEIAFDGRNDSGEKLASGVYIYQIESENFIKARKMAMMK
ncbi:MAG: T9SS type A sorting domain-containing protein [Candidatus Jorgensenbacteria bacterium]|nr:T9SS type A sorting domain-containing protein [Candidatus Jorgensenbacteria bacterium]